MNLATEYLKQQKETVHDWDGFCGELANEISDKDTDHIIYVEGDIGWKYHMVLFRDGLIHDAWCPGDARPLREWLAEMFGEHAWVELALDGVDFFAGHVRDFIFEPS